MKVKMASLDSRRLLYNVGILLWLALASRSDSTSGLRPSSSELLPVVELIEPIGDLYNPNRNDIDPIVLRQKLGQSFDVSMMSEHRPVASILHPNGTVSLKIRRNKAGQFVPDGHPPNFITRIQLDNVRLSDGRKVALKFGNKMKRRFRDLLWLKSHCPLLQKWKDFGPRFWPRWILENSCVQRVSCSFPRGMTCRPNRSTYRIILRWHCQDWETRFKCQWLKVEYPQVTECKCSC